MGTSFGIKHVSKTTKKSSKRKLLCSSRSVRLDSNGLGEASIFFPVQWPSVVISAANSAYLQPNGQETTGKKKTPRLQQRRTSCTEYETACLWPCLVLKFACAALSCRERSRRKLPFHAIIEWLDIMTEHTINTRPLVSVARQMSDDRPI